jgi:hypothetical protein
MGVTADSLGMKRKLTWDDDEVAKKPRLDEDYGKDDDKESEDEVTIAPTIPTIQQLLKGYGVHWGVLVDLLDYNVEHDCFGNPEESEQESEQESARESEQQSSHSASQVSHAESAEL